jgi:hypothetical protein
MPEAVFYSSIITLCSSHRGASSMAKMLLKQPDRGGLQLASFHTVRTYLTLLRKALQAWFNGFPEPGEPPAILVDAQNWLKMQNKPDGN